MNCRKKDEKGFSMVELLGVMAIISILFIFLVPKLTNGFEKARIASIKMDLEAYAKGVGYYGNRNGELSDNPKEYNEYLDDNLQFDGNESIKLTPYKKPYRIEYKNNNIVEISTEDSSGNIYSVKLQQTPKGIITRYEGFREDEKMKQQDFETEEEELKKEVGKEITRPEVVIEASNEWEKEKNIKYEILSNEDKIIKKEYSLIKKEQINKEIYVETTAMQFNLQNETGEFLFILRLTTTNGEKYVYEKPINIDNEKPKIEIESTTNEEIKKSHTAEIIVKEEYSGIKEILYKWTKQDEVNQGWEILKGRTIKTPESVNGEYYLQIKAIDNAKNEEEVKSRKFIIDNKKPTIKIEKNGNEGYEKQANAKVTAIDESEIKSIEYKWTKEGDVDVTSWKGMNNGELVKLEGNYTGSYYLKVRVKDIADNEEEIKSKEYRLDNNKPKIITQGERIEVEDLESGVEEIKYAWRSTEKDLISEWVKIESGTTIPKSNLDATKVKYIVEATDKAGNKSTYESQEYIIDKEEPKIVLNRNGNVEFEKEPKVIITAKDEYGVAKVEYVWSKEKEMPKEDWKETVSGEEVTKKDDEGEFYLHVKATDKNGNIGKLTSERFKIDNVAPNIVYSTAIKTTPVSSTRLPVYIADLRGVTSATYKWMNSSELSVETGTIATTSLNPAHVTTPSVTNEEGVYTLSVTANDGVGNSITKTHKMNIDTKGPTISISPNSGTSANNHKPKVTINDGFDLNRGSIKMTWTTSTSVPSSYKTMSSLPYSSTSTRYGTNGYSIQLTGLNNLSSVAVEGNYYLHVEVTDVAGNKTYLRSGMYTYIK